MRARTSTLLAIAALLLALIPLSPAAADLADGTTITLAQQPGTDQQVEGGEGQDDDGTGSSDEEAETGVEEGQEEGAAEETGPPWTYQMARISLVLLALLALGMGLLYFRLVISRRKGEV
ncbi:MAG: hypothetical protein M3285_09665 [Actinomycetota bacterium]|nr:hypothetical protein [Actinomycetota bacterium]